MSYVQSRSESEAHDIFNRIRDGGYEDIFNLLRQVRGGQLNSPELPIYQGHHPNSPNSELRLPSIQRMFEVSGAAQPPLYGAPQAPSLIMTPGNTSSSQSLGSQSRDSRSTEPAVTTAPA